MLSKQSMSPLLLAQFNRAIKALTINGEIARIVYKWQQISLAQQSKISNQYGLFYRLYAGLLTFDIAR